jgi:tetratricopeptide (TPR) repeat protein
MPFVRSAITLARERKSRSPDRGLPNSAAFFVLAGYIERRSGRWDDAQNDFSTAVKLDPRNPNAVNLLADTYILRRRYEEAEQTYARAIAAGLDTPIVRFRKAEIAFSPVGDVAILRTALAQVPPDLDVGGGETALRVFVDLVDHNYDAAARTLAASPREDFQEVDFSFYYPRSWYEAIIARARGDAAGARDSFAAAREVFESRLTIKPEDPRTLAVLAQVDAALGNKELATTEARRAVDLMPLSRDAYDGVLVLQGLAQVYTWTAEKDLALEVLEKLMSLPGYLSYGYLRVDRLWDPLRGDPRFGKFIGSFAPKAPSK